MLLSFLDFVDVVVGVATVVGTAIVAAVVVDVGAADGDVEHEAASTDAVATTATSCQRWRPPNTAPPRLTFSPPPTASR